jgi:2-C-methyl-D-erythritol 4-phosphate cytidylyltransferase
VQPAIAAVNASNWEAATAALPAADAAAHGADAKYVIAQIRLRIGIQTNNVALQARAIQYVVIVEVTDDAMAMELLGLRPLLVEGAEDNFKVTTPADLVRFEFELFLRARQP